MFTLERTAWIVTDICRTELVKQKTDSLAFFDTETPLDFASVPAEVLHATSRQVGAFFGFHPVNFFSFEELTCQAFEAYQKNQSVYLATSGSTGTPKLFKHTRQMMEIEADCVGSYFKQAKRFITLTPRHHLYGLSFGIFFPYVFGTPAVALPAIPVRPWFSLLQEGDVVAGFPLFWEYFLKAGNRFPRGVTAVTSTAPCPKGLFARLKEAGAERVVELYGASETGGIGVRYSEEEPFRINDFWDVDATVFPPVIYRKGMDNWVNFPDEIRFVPPRAMFPLKRTDSAVQVAGVNVFPKHIEQVLQQYEAVKECRVRLMRPEEGHRLKAFIVLGSGNPEHELPKIKAFLSNKLSSHEMPRSFTFGKQIPKNTMGKDSDW